jgi:uncharacterized repeat protein (TIGR03803 family)
MSINYLRQPCARAHAIGICLLIGSPALGATETVLYRFPSGGNPYAGLVIDAAGSLYGTTFLGGRTLPGNLSSGGFVFRLDPPITGRSDWSLTVLHSFAGGFDGQNPLSGLTSDGAGGFFGATRDGGRSDNGVVFEIDPPTSGHSVWSKVDLYRFAGGDSRDASLPDGAVTLDATGSLYGTTTSGGAHGYGTVFKLDPPQSVGNPWNETILRGFGAGNDGESPIDQILLDEMGNVYGVTISGGGARRHGVAFKLTPPSSAGAAWSETILHRFTGVTDGNTPSGGMILDGTGTLYGTAQFGGGACGKPIYGCGVIYKLTPPAAGHTVWSETILYRFKGGNDGASPNGPLLADATGALYGTTSDGGGSGEGFGAVFKLTPPPAGHTVWTETILYRFQGGEDGANPTGSLVAGASGNLYGTTAYGGGPENNGNGWGTIFKITP